MNSASSELTKFTSVLIRTKGILIASGKGSSNARVPLPYRAHPLETALLLPRLDPYELQMSSSNAESFEVFSLKVKYEQVCQKESEAIARNLSLKKDFSNMKIKLASASCEARAQRMKHLKVRWSIHWLLQKLIIERTDKPCPDFKPTKSEHPCISL